MLIDKGDKLLVTHRRLYEKETERFFVGVVDAYEQGVAKVSGYTWIHDIPRGRLIRKEDLRCKLIPLTSGNYIVYVLPSHLDIESTRIDQIKQRLLLTNGSNFTMDISDRQVPA